MEKEIFKEFNLKLNIYKRLCEDKIITIDDYFNFIINEVCIYKDSLDKPYLKQEVNINENQTITY